MSNMIKTTAAITFSTLLAGVAALGVAAPANAHAMKHKMAAETAMPAGTPLDQAIRTSNGTNFSLSSEASLDSADAQILQDTTSPAKLQQIRADIASNRALVKKITAENIGVNNIVGASRAADGGLILYTM